MSELDRLLQVINKLDLQRMGLKVVAILTIVIGIIASHLGDTKVLVIPIFLVSYLDTQCRRLEEGFREAYNEEAEREMENDENIEN